MAMRPVSSSSQKPVTQPASGRDLKKELLEAANRAIATKDFQNDAPAPTGFDAKNGVDLQVSRKEQMDNGIVGRRAFNVAGQLFIEDTVMLPNGNMAQKWKQGKKALAIE